MERLPFRLVLYRADRGSRPRTVLPVSASRSNEGWCDDPDDRNNNRRVRLPANGKEEGCAEGLMREDALYDVVLVLGYNDRPRIKNRGSATFAHLARNGFRPTEGCIALSRRDLLAVLNEAKRGTAFLVMH